MRLVFHDCMRYQDGTGGCDGCINFKVHFDKTWKICPKLFSVTGGMWRLCLISQLWNLQGVGHAGPSPHNKDDYYKTKPINETDNNGMDQVNSMVMIKTTTTKLMKMMITTMLQITMKLEQIYTTVDWPFKNASINASLFQLGISHFASHLRKGKVSNLTIRSKVVFLPRSPM